MRCALHATAFNALRLRRRRAHLVVFGLSVCDDCAPDFVSRLIEGGSVRQILQQARDGELL